MFTKPRTFATCESGAVTVDWVVLTAALVGLALSVAILLSAGLENLAGDIRNTMANTNPVTDPFPANTDVTAGNDVVLQ